MAWTESSQNKKYTDWVVMEESLVLPDSAGATATSVDSSAILRNVGDRKFIAQLEVTEASGGNGSLDAKLMASLDNENWVDVDAVLGVSLNSSVLNEVAVGIFDATDVEAPFFKIQIFSDGTDTIDDATIKLTIAFLG